MNGICRVALSLVVVGIAAVGTLGEAERSSDTRLLTDGAISTDGGAATTVTVHDNSTLGIILR